MKRMLAALLVLSAAALADDEKKLVFETPKEWKAQEVKAGGFAPKQQWALEKVEGDDEAPTVRVYHFGGGGGGLKDNVKRWCGQFKTDKGEAFDPKDAKQETFEANGYKITTVEISGTYTPPAMMGGGDPKKDQKLIAAYIDGPGGPWFVKLQGPEKSVDKNKDAYVKWLKSAKSSDDAKKEK